MVKLIINKNNHPETEEFLKNAFGHFPDTTTDNKIWVITMITEETAPPHKEARYIFTSRAEIKLENNYLYVKGSACASVIDLKFEQPMSVKS